MSRDEDRVVAVAPGRIVGNWLVQGSAMQGPETVLRAHHVEVATTEATVRVADRSPESERDQSREVQALRKLDHGAIPKLVDFGADDDMGLLYVATEPVDGILLSDSLLTGPMDWREACILFYSVARALAHCHAVGIVHRDVNPSKILVQADFTGVLAGFERAMDAAELSRAASAPLGTLRYVAPEVIADPYHHAPRADLYALGVCLFETITGRAAFPAAAWGERLDPTRRMLEWKTRADALDIGDYGPPWLASLIRKATHPDSAQRLPDMDAFVGWLEAARDSWNRPVSMPQEEQTAKSAPPRLTMATPNLGPNEELLQQLREIRDAANQPPPPRELAYLAAGTLGMVAGLAFSALVIVLVEVSTV